MEQLLVRNKAEYAKNTDAVSAMMIVKSPQQCKKISNRLDQTINMKHWLDAITRKLMKEDIRATFSQNHYLKQFPLNTKDTKLVQANLYDQFWSCGIGIKNTQDYLMKMFVLDRIY